MLVFPNIFWHFFFSLCLIHLFPKLEVITPRRTKSKGEAKQTSSCLKGTGQPAVTSFLSVRSWNSSVISLSMCQKGRSTDEQRWTLMSRLTSGGIFSPTFICCRLFSSLNTYDFIFSTFTKLYHYLLFIYLLLFFVLEMF